MLSAQFTGNATDAPPEMEAVGRGANTFLGEADHRIANNLLLVAGLVRMQGAELAKRSKPIDPRDVQQLVAEVAARIDAVARLHRLLSDPDAHAGVDIGAYLQDICSSLVSSLAPPGTIALTHKWTKSCLVSPREAPPLALIVSEMVTNAIKHAHPTGIAGKIAVGCHQEADGMLVVEVADDGVGLPDGFDPAVDGGFGLRLAHRFARQLKARLVFHQTGLGLRILLLKPAQ